MFLTAIKEAIEDRLGKCYQLTGGHILCYPHCRLVHGTLTNILGAPGLKKIDHAWIEYEDENQSGYEHARVFDPVMDKDYTKIVYYALCKAQPQKIYSGEDAIRLMDKYKHYGPWDE